MLDRQPSGTRVAVFGDQWVYPAFGDRLHLQPVRLDRNGTMATVPIADAMEPGNRTVSPATFRSTLEAAGIGLVVVVHQPHPGRPADFPTQHAALEATADAHLVYRNRGVVIWRLGSRERPRPARASRRIRRSHAVPGFRTSTASGGRVRTSECG